MIKMSSLLCILFLNISCIGLKQQKENSEDLNNENTKKENLMTGQIATFFTFQNENAEQAMNFYIELFDNSEIVSLSRWGKDAPGREGTIMHASFLLKGNLFMCSDSPPVHEWGFTPAVSNFVECKDEEEIERLFNKLSENGMVMMPLNNYGFSQKFAFIQDQFDVSWQLNLK